MSANQDHWEASRRERVFAKKAFEQLQRQSGAAVGPPASVAADCAELDSRKAAPPSDPPHVASVPACDEGVWRATYTGLSSDERQRRTARYQQEMDERYSAKLPNRFSSVNYAQQW